MGRHFVTGPRYGEDSRFIRYFSNRFWPKFATRQPAGTRLTRSLSTALSRYLEDEMARTRQGPQHAELLDAMLAAFRDATPARTTRPKS
jgi:hypothetical protein